MKDDEAAAPTPPGRSSPRVDEARRRLLRSAAVGGVVVCASLLALLDHRAVEAAPRLRPPGALDEEDFLAACIKCGQCVQVCPVDAIRLSDLDRGIGNGVPYIAARAQACDFSCDATQCVLACPTGALSHLIDAKEQSRMGVARLAAPDACLARKGEGFKGLARGEAFKGHLRYSDIDRWKPQPVASHPYDLGTCDLCARHCPIKDAIELVPVSSDPQDRRRTPMVKDACVGCGVCEMMCPAEPAAIRVDVRVKGRDPGGPKT
ncbi:4Fe-4S dicluster domain-containing protein [Bradyrhizobium sp. UNPA324]|uniref:4Fe-4S dicluster domain-containing protein n=1 Tax=Bradyrhizobium sp. UNPA324 TaxID=1141174 RepID=UPI0011523F86|nr:4Fe-4S dicluster domain-containing protein [Bradyrhizobium sp. UNPA324]TQF33567.1 4Fe-4S ferredoxin [Bradyrhizobium sp. UNPA324]